jgi:hypothetical protein
MTKNINSVLNDIKELSEWNSERSLLESNPYQRDRFESIAAAYAHCHIKICNAIGEKSEFEIVI